MPLSRYPNLGLRLLPLWLLASMVIIGCGLEWWVYDELRLASKVPLALLIVWPLLRRRR